MGVEGDVSALSGELEEMAEATDFLPACPVKVVEYEGLEPFSPSGPVAPVPVAADPAGTLPDPRLWKYRVC